MELFYKRFMESEVLSEKGELLEYKMKKLDTFNFAYDVLDVLARDIPDHDAVVWANPDGDEKIISFRELKEKSDACASFLLSLGIRKGDAVMMVLKRHYEYWYTYLALHKIGAIGIPATSQLHAKDYQYRFELADVRAIIATNESNVPDYVEQAEKEYGKPLIKVICRAKRDGWHNFGDGLDNAKPFVKPEKKDLPKPDDTMLLYFTSGTTGMPKMVMHDYYYPLGLTMMAIYWHKVVPGGRHLTLAETGWAKAAWGKMYGAWMGGSAFFVYDYEKFNAAEICRVLEKYRVTTFCAPPTIYRFLIQEDLTAYDFSALKHATIAGEALNPEVFNKFYNATGLKLMEGFGQTELVLVVSSLCFVTPKPGSMGKPTPDFQVDIVDDDGNSVSAGTSGEVVVRADRKNKPYGMFKGYYKDEELTNAVWRDGVYHTGDLAWRDEDGFYWYVSRKDDIIKSSGYRIGPFEVESVLMEHDAVMECAVTGVPDPIRGQVVKATIVLTKKYAPSEKMKKEIQEYVKTHTAPYKYPRIIEFVDALPKTISGKIKRIDIRNKGEK